MGRTKVQGRRLAVAARFTAPEPRAGTAPSDTHVVRTGVFQVVPVSPCADASQTDAQLSQDDNVFDLQVWREPLSVRAHEAGVDVSLHAPQLAYLLHVAAMLPPLLLFEAALRVPLLVAALALAALLAFRSLWRRLRLR